MGTLLHLELICAGGNPAWLRSYRVSAGGMPHMGSSRTVNTVYRSSKQSLLAAERWRTN